jgi:quercetin dioxygenase-like cupin family protein
VISVNQHSEYKTVGEGVERKLLATGGELMTVQFRFAPGAVGALHSHPHEQIGYVVSGRFEFTLDGVTHTLGPGDSYYVPPHAVHGARALEASILVDVFTPQRQDFLG